MNARFADKKCLDCGQPFRLEAGEVAFFARKNYDLPKRCKPCRDRRKAQRDLDPLPKPLLKLLADADGLARASVPSECRLAYIDLFQTVKGVVHKFGPSLRLESYDRLLAYGETRNNVDHEKHVPSKAQISDLVAFALSTVDELHFHEPAFQQIAEFFRFPNVEHPGWHTELWARGHPEIAIDQVMREIAPKLLETAGATNTNEETDHDVLGDLGSVGPLGPDWTPVLRSWPDILAGPDRGMEASEIALAADVVTLPGDALRRRNVWAECLHILPAFYICCRREYAYEVLASTESLPNENVSVLVFYDSYGQNFADPYSAKQLSDLRRLHDGLAKLEGERDDGKRLGLARQLVEVASPDLILQSVSFYPVRPANEPFPIALEDYLWSLGESLLDWYFMNQNAEFGEPGWGHLKQGAELASALDDLIRKEVLASPEELQALGVCAPRGISRG